jgi:hypothetical protein
MSAEVDVLKRPRLQPCRKPQKLKGTLVPEGRTSINPALVQEREDLTF